MLPRVIIHNGVSLDGRMDSYTAGIGLYYSLAGTWEVEAILSGSNTILAAFQEIETEGDAQTAPEERTDGGEEDWVEPQQLLVVIDSRGRVRNWATILRQPYWRDAIALCSQSTPQEYLDYLDKEGVAYIRTGTDKVDLQEALQELNTRFGVQSVRVDSGGILNGALLRAGLVDEVSVVISPSLAGGNTPNSIFQAEGLGFQQGIISLKLVQFERLEGDAIWLRYEVIKS
jgi:2,5-diamino-6-(ribosylamino)-4(3H)-pyrimidinone 5'-phosphate reductase